MGVRGPQRPLVYLLNIEPCEQTIHRKYVMFVFKNTHQQNTCEQASWGVGVQGHLGICSCEQGMAAGQGPGFPQNLLPTPWQAGRQAGRRASWEALEASRVPSTRRSRPAEVRTRALAA